MNKKLALAFIVGMFTQQAAADYNYPETEHVQAVRNLTTQTGWRKGLKYWTHTNIPALTASAVIASALAGRYAGDKEVEFGLYTLLAACIVESGATLWREGHTWYAKRLFSSLSKKRVDEYGNLIDPFTNPYAPNYPYAIDDRLFITYGFAAGYTAEELIKLANKSGRTEVARQISDGEFFAGH